ncbi:MAG: GntR family transcriptional regulator, partial [Aestuariivirga sp.]
MTIWTPQLAPDRPRYAAIAEAMRSDLLSGVLKPGDRLPTHRDLAYRLGVTTGTVTRAYAEAEKFGILVGEVGRGSFLRAPG